MAKIITRKLKFLVLAATPLTFPFPLSYFPRLFSTLSQHALPSLHTPFAVFAAAQFNLSSADISRLLKRRPSLNNLQTLENLERVVHILIKHGCTPQQIAQIMMKESQLFVTNAEKLLEPKIQLLKDYGIQGQILTKVLSRLPKILCSNLERCLLPNIALLKNTFKSQDSLVKAISKYPSILHFNHERVLKPSVAFWEGCGLSGDELSKFLLGNPHLMAFSSLTSAHLDLVQKIGIPQGHKMYKFILKIIATSRMETLETKIQNLQLCGLTPRETLILIRVYPSTLSLSVENVREKMGFVVNQMELPANFVVKNSRLLGMSLGKVIKPRFSVVQKIKSMKGVEKPKLQSFGTILKMPEPRFLRSIIAEHPESSTLYDLYQDAVNNASTSKKIASKGFLFLRLSLD